VLKFYIIYTNGRLGTPKITIKVPGCLKNPNGRIIRVDGPQYKKLLENGYKPSDDGLRLIPDDNYKYTEIQEREADLLVVRIKYRKINHLKS